MQEPGYRSGVKVADSVLEIRLPMSSKNIASAGGERLGEENATRI